MRGRCWKLHWRPPGGSECKGDFAAYVREIMPAMLAVEQVARSLVILVQTERQRPSPLPDEASAEVVRVLAAMTLHHIEEVHA